MIVSAHGIRRCASPFTAAALSLIFVFAGASRGIALEPVVLREKSMDGKFIGRHAEFMEDRDRNLLIEDVLSDTYSGRFRPASSDTPSFGVTLSAYWIRFAVKNDSAEPVTWLLEFANPVTNRIDVYARRGGAVRKIATLGNLYAGNSAFRHIAPNVGLEGGPGVTEYYLRVQTNTSMIIPLRAWSAELFQEHVVGTTALLAVFYGILLVMLLYNLAIFVFSRERRYLYFMFNNLSILLFTLVNDGSLFTYVIPFNFFLINATYSFLFLVAATGFAFSRTFLETWRHVPALDRRVLRPSMIASGVMAAAYLPMMLAVRIQAQWLMAPFMTLVMVLVVGAIVSLVATGVIYLARRQRAGYFYCAGYFFFLAGALSQVLREYDIVPATEEAQYLFNAGVIAMFILFSLGLADYINSIRRKVLSLNEDLSKKNAALTRSNEELVAAYEEMEAQTEELSGAYDRLEILARALDQADEEIVIADGKGIVRYVNPVFQRITGTAHEAVLGKPLKEIVCSGIDDPHFDPREILEAGNAWRGQVVRGAGEGAANYYDMTVTPLKDSYGRVTSLVMFRRDVSEQTRLHNQLIHSQKMDAIGTLVGGLSHDFNNILGGITAGVSMLDIELQGVPQRQAAGMAQYLDIIKTSADRAADLIRRLLSLSRKIEPARVPFDLNIAVKNIRRICENSLPKSVSLDFRCSPEPVVVMADLLQMEQVLLNLCINASHAMTIMRGDEPQGGTLRVTLGAAMPDDPFLARKESWNGDTRYALLEVADDGVGIESDHIQRIFEPFFTTKKRENGTGLGLAMVYRIMIQHEGLIDVQSSPGAGTAMRLYVPLSVDAPAPADGGEKKGLPQLKGAGRVLIVDDELPLCRVMAGILRAGGYDPIYTISAREGIALFEQQREGLKMVLLDMSLPELSGLDVYRRIYALEPAMPVLIVSGYPMDERIEAALNLGAAGFLSKPFDAGALLDKVHQLLGKNGK